MRAGSLRHRAVLESYSVAQDDIGDEVQTWATVKSIWCDINPVAVTESYEADQSVHRITHEVRIRANAGTIDCTMRLNHDGRYFYLMGLKDPSLRGIQNIWTASEKVE